MELIQANNATLPDGHRYSGWGHNKCGEFLPQGCGKKFFNGYYVYGNFRHGVIDGPAIESHDNFMQTMQYKNGKGNGWGLCMNRGQLSEFGYYEDNKLKVDLSDFALWYFTKLQKAGRNENMLTVYTFKDSHEVAELLIGYKPTPIENGVGLVGMGFHFMADGSVWMGNTATRRFTGKLIHFCSNGTVDCGEFVNGELKQRLELQEIINAYYGTFEISNDSMFADLFGSRELNPVREQFRNAQPIKPGYNYFQSIDTCPIPKSAVLNHFSMDYTVWEVDFTATGNFISLGDEDEDEEIWKIGDSFIETPHGILKIEDAIFIEEGPLVGVQFSVSGSLKMNDFRCSNGWENEINISTFALMRQPHNAWLWVYTFDENGNPLANFCGTDILNGLADFMPFLKRKFLKR